MNREAIQSYISSSEFNRCKKNNLNLFEACDWWFVVSMPWMTRKLRRKIGHLWQMGLLPELPRKPLIYISEPFPGFSEMFAKQYLAIEDHFILTGETKSQV